MTSENFKKRLAIGKDGENEVAELFITRGYCVLPLYQFNDDVSPKIFSLNTTYTSPDLFISNNCSCLWVEVKTKYGWIKFSGMVETGLNERHYNDYLLIKEKTGLPFYVFFNHKKEEPLGFYFINLITPYRRIWDGLNSSTGRRVSPSLVLWEYNMLTKYE